MSHLRSRKHNMVEDPIEFIIEDLTVATRLPFRNSLDEALPNCYKVRKYRVQRCETQAKNPEVHFST